MFGKKLIAPILLAGLLLALLISMFITSGGLPDRLATHFNEQGVANGWMEKDAFLIFTFAMAVVTIGFMLAVFWAIRFLPPSAINLPNRDYWLSRDQQSGTFAKLFHWGVELAIGVTALQVYLYLAIIRANQIEPPHLSSGIWIITTLFLAFVVTQIIRLFRRLKVPGKS